MRINIKKAVIPIALTFFLGPGAGHIYLGMILKGLMLLAAVFCGGLVMFLQAVSAAGGLAAAQQNPARVLADFYAAYPDTVLAYDIFFAGLWAYAFVDAFFKSQEGAAEDGKRTDDTNENG